MDGAGVISDEQTLQVGDLGRFSMRAIYDALSSSAHASTSPSVCRRSQEEDPEDSDCSWTQDDDNGTVYFDMQRRLNAFATSGSQPTMTTPPLSKGQRRFVHATAQILRLGHASLGPPGRLRRMIVFKDSSASFLDLPALQHSVQPSPASLPPTKKRRRLERAEKGFPCHFCTKLFDRASERTKHEQAHQPNLTSRHPCPVCGKGFRYPKDLRRHGRVHDKPTPRSGTQSLSSSYDSAAPQSALTTDSRIPSEASLTFSSNTASNDVSPLLLGRIGERDLELDFEPLLLDELAGIKDADDWLFDPRLGFENGQDEDFLEMAQARL